MIVDLKKVTDALTELSDESYQRRVWCGSSNDDLSEMSTFTEARSTLFDDSGLANAIEGNKPTGLSIQGLAALIKLREEARKIDDSIMSDEEIVDSKPMANIRQYAAEAKTLMCSTR